MPAKSLKPGEKVRWKASQGTITGTVVKKQTSKTKIKTHKVSASRASPEYIVRSDKTGAKAAHKPSALKKVAR